MINIILFGPPGSGKGTQAAHLAEYYGFSHISTGDLFRSEISQNTALGRKAQEFIGLGQLVPDEITIGMLKNKIDSSPDAKGFIFDGFPRTVPQALALDHFLTSKKQAINLLLSLEVPEDHIVERILKRGKTSGRPDDNDESVIRKRFKVYLDETAVVYDHYARKGVAQKVQGVGNIDEIFRALCRCIDIIIRPATL